MANKIYDFLPAHLRNSELESIFDVTLERVFSKGNVRKEKAFIGRKEKGIYSDKDVYLSFPEHLYQRDNYGLEPVFSNTEVGDNVFYDDLLNAMFNKGMLTNDHRRLFNSKSNTVNLPIDADKFANWTMYYWVNTGFFANGNQESDNKHYVTIEKATTGNWWSNNNAWYHYDDIREFITSANQNLIEQAKRPIIEFDDALSLSADSTAKDLADANWEQPKFNADDGNAYSIFEYVTSAAYPMDYELGFAPKLKAGDLQSEYVFIIDVPNDVKYQFTGAIDKSMYTVCNFNYRNLRHEVGAGIFSRIELTQSAIGINDIDVYVDGIKQIGNYTYDDTDNVIEFNDIADGYVYVDYATTDAVVTDGDYVWQRVNPAIEYNIDNEYHNLKELTYSTIYEHMVRMIETTDGLTGEPNGDNNFRLIGDNTDKTRFNDLGSILVRNSIDIKKAYFAITRNDYDPIKSTEFLSTAYNNFKNKFITVVRDILSDTGSVTKTTTEILEQAISEISLAKRESISVFDGTMMINSGEKLSHYIVGNAEIIVGSRFQPIPDAMIVSIILTENLSVYLNGVLQLNKIDYNINGSEIEFVEYTAQIGDVIELRYYEKLANTFVPPSSSKLDINALYIPRVVTDSEYHPDVEMILGHDGSLVPAWNDRTDEILLEFETMIFNRLSVTSTDNTIKFHNYGMYRDASEEYSVAEKKYTQYPFFKKWMIRNNIDNLYNDTFDPDDWKTWNYRSINESSPGHWRGIMEYVYGTDNPVAAPWVTIGLSQKPDGFDAYGTDYTQVSFWENIKTAFSKDWPVPVTSNGQIETINNLFFSGSITTSEVTLMDQDWEFGDGSPVELAWRRSSEYAFAQFLLMMLTKPFEVIDNYSVQIDHIISYFNAREGFNSEKITAQREQYEFKLGSKLGGYVNNFKLLSENSGLSNSRYTDIPRDNYDLFVHAGEPNRSESFSAIVIEKVSVDKDYPTYDRLETATYSAGDVLLNPYDHKYYKRKTTGSSAKESANTIKFDYTMWTLISQPKTREFGYRVHGYDDFNPVFFSMDWDKTSGQKVWKTDGDPANLKTWTGGEYYRQDSYVMFNSKPYVSLINHTAATTFDDDKDNWKLLSEWPRINQVEAYGYKETLPDQIKTYNYGDILSTRDQVAHLMVGYQDYLNAVGWDFTDTDVDNNVVDFGKLLEKFLDWSAETHQPGDFITLTPILFSGAFETPYGVATIGKETNKNFYRVVDEAGRQIPTTEIEFNSANGKITWESTLPIYGIKIDIADIEQAFVVDRVDSYGDVIYDPLSHNRNLRMMVDCNRTADWDGTLAADGYIVSNNELVPNLETMVSETQFYRDTIVDQSLKNINMLKSSQIGYSPRTYLANHGVERESQLEFYKGFLANKSTVGSINKIINFNSNFNDIKHNDVWAIKLSDYGTLDNNLSVSSVINTDDIISDPHVVTFDADKKFTSLTNKKRVAIKTSGYVDPADVNYVVTDPDALNSSELSYFEGDLAWVRFDPVREWDVKRLSEIAEIFFVSETGDGQLKVALTNEIETGKLAYLKIVNINIDPIIEGNYYFVEEDSYELNGSEIYEYLVFDQSFEPLIVEIDTTTDNSVYVPTSSDIGVEAIGLISNPVFEDGDTLIIDNEVFVYAIGSGSVSSGITIGGETATSDPIVSEGEQVRIVVYGTDGIIANANTLVTFSGNNATADTTVISVEGDKIDIDGVTVTIDYSATQSIRTVSSATIDDDIPTGFILELDSDGGSNDTVTVEDIVVVGTIANPTITETKSIRIQGVFITLDTPSPKPADVTETFTATAAQTDFTIAQALSVTTYSVGTVTVDSVATTDYTVVGQILTLNSPALAGGETLELTLTHADMILETQGIVDKINASGVGATASINISNTIEISSTSATLDMSGDALLDIGMSSNSIFVSKLGNLADELNALSYIDSYIAGGVLVIETDNNTLTLSGTAFNSLGFPSNTFEQNSNPTAASISQQINAMLIPNVTATVTLGKLKIKSSAPSLTVAENSTTPDSMLRLGFAVSSVTVTSVDSIVADLNSALDDVSNTIADQTLNNRQIVITSGESIITISDVTGNAWSDMGISSGTYINNTSLSTTAAEFREQINAQSDIVEVNISSDGRMIFTNSNTEMSFTGTIQTVLDTIGLSPNYTSVTSNADFKIMRWKTVRFTPNFNGTDFDEFYTALGLNDESLVWADEYSNYGWAVLQRNSVGVLAITSRQAPQVDTDYISRVVATSGDTFYDYQLFDPINFKMAGSITKDIDYVDFNDPAKYDIALNNDLWLSQNLGTIWWDTNLARYYRYNDIGDANGNINITYAKRFWGKIVPGSEIVVKQWVSSEVLADDVTSFNTEIYFDSIRNKLVTKYYYWTSVGAEARYSKDLSIEEISMMIASPTTINKFFPVDNDTIIISNNANITTEKTVTYSIDYRVDKNREVHHSDWELVSRSSTVALDNTFLVDFKNSIANSTVIQHEQFSVQANQITASGTVFSYYWIGANSLTNNDIVISVNNNIVPANNFYINVDEVTITNTLILAGDVIRVYQLSEYDSWFTDINGARDNFASVLHNVLNKRMLMTDYPQYADYITLDHGIFNSANWYYSDEYQTIESFDYISRTRDIDMISLYESGVTSFKVELTEADEYYFPVNNEIRLVHKTDAVLDLDFNTELTQNQISVQLHELMNMLYAYADVSDIKNIFFDMIEYMYTERSHPEWIFKTSYIDLTMFNKPLRQYAIYQRDSYQDTIDYVTETKPYHVKIRKTDRIYPKDEIADLNTTALHEMLITKDFGNHSRFELNGIDGGSSFSNTWTDDPLQSEIDLYNPLSEGTYQAGTFLRNDIEYTASANGFDTGPFHAHLRDAAVVTVDTFTDDTLSTLDKKEFYVYDNFGRGHHIPVKDTGTIASFDGDILTVDQASKFKSAKSNTVRLIAVENTAGNIEFMLYNSKSTNKLSISERAVYTGVASDFEVGATVYVLGSPDQIYSHEDA